MFISFNIKLSEENPILKQYPKVEVDKFYESQKNKIDSDFDFDFYKYLKNDILDGNEISNDWFPNIDANIFISHSHMDEEYIKKFAYWLKKKFGLDSFIDSCLWGYSNKLLKQIDNEYCKTNYSNKYDYEKRNISTSHVHMMLNVALMKMINKCECVFFINTPNSIPIENTIKNAQSTLSPWIYSEIEITKYLKKIPPTRYRYIESLYESNNELKVKYDINLDHLINIDDEMLKIWNDNYNNIPNSNALDILYKQLNVLKEEING